MEVRLPRLGEGADTGTVAAIFVKEGDPVKKEQAILELESEKAVASIPTPHAGVISKIHVREGDEIKVGDLIASVTEDGGQSSTAQATQPEPVRTAPASRPAPPPPEHRPPSTSAISEPSTSDFAPPASPSIRKIARELGIDLRRVRGSERGGRILLADVRAYVQQLQQLAFQQPATGRSEPRTVTEQIDFSKWGSVSKKKMSSIRKTISQRMVQSWTTLPHITQFDDVDITFLNELRKKYSSHYEKQGAKLTLTPFILTGLAHVLREFPMFNASYDEAAGDIVFKEYYHIGIAVDTEHGLLVPVIRDVDKKDLRDLSIELSAIAEKARDRKITLEEMQGGTFTLSNQGGIGGSYFTPIINKPEVAILGMGRASLRPVVRGKKIEARLILPLGLSYDHRLIDGADAARFITRFVGVLEEFSEDNVRPGPGGSRSPKAVKKGKK